MSLPFDPICKAFFSKSRKCITLGSTTFRRLTFNSTSLLTFNGRNIELIEKDEESFTNRSNLLIFPTCPSYWYNRLLHISLWDNEDKISMAYVWLHLSELHINIKFLTKMCFKQLRSIFLNPLAKLSSYICNSDAPWMRPFFFCACFCAVSLQSHTLKTFKWGRKSRARPWGICHKRTVLSVLEHCPKNTRNTVVWNLQPIPVMYG